MRNLDCCSDPRGSRPSPIKAGALDAPSTETARRSEVNTPPGLAEQGDRIHARPTEV
jgi:hypothetical protein